MTLYVSRFAETQISTCEFRHAHQKNYFRTWVGKITKNAMCTGGILMAQVAGTNAGGGRPTHVTTALVTIIDFSFDLAISMLTLA